MLEKTLESTMFGMVVDLLDQRSYDRVRISVLEGTLIELYMSLCSQDYMTSHEKRLAERIKRVIATSELDERIARAKEDK